MTVPEFLSHLGSLFNLCAVYYVIQLIRCAMASFVITAAVLLLRRTLFKNCIFLKAALWSLCFPALFATVFLQGMCGCAGCIWAVYGYRFSCFAKNEKS